MAFPGKHPTPKRERAWSEMEGVEFRPRALSGPPFIDRASSEMQVDTPSQRTPTPTFIDLTADESPVGPRRAARQMQVSEAGTDTTIVGTPDLNTRVTLLEQGQRRHDDTLMAINGQISLMSTRMDDSEMARRKDEQRRKRQREEDKEQRGWERYEDNQENERRHSQIFGLLREGINLVSHHMGGGAQIPTENPYHVPPSNIAPSAAGASTGGGYRAYSTGTAPRPAFDNHRTPDGRRKRQRAARPRKAAAPIPPTSTGTANPLAPRVRFPLPPRIPPPPAAAWATRAGNPAARAYPPVATQTQYPPSTRPPSTPGSSIGNRSQPAAGPPDPRTPAPNGA